jgi:HAD superfamily hydrolase (TIGR01509 family)
MQPRAIIFDLFDTLVDLPMERLPTVEIDGRVVRSTTRALHATLTERVPIEFERFAAALGEVDRAWREGPGREGRELATVERFTRLCARLELADPELPERLTNIHMGMIAGLAETPAHHASVLDELRARVRLGLCSNFSHAPTALAILEQAELLARLDAIAISHEVGLRKPRREIFEAVLARLGVAPEQAIHVGDSLDADVAGAAALGLRTVWLTRRIADAPAALARHQGPRPDWILRDLGEIPQLFSNSHEI